MFFFFFFLTVRFLLVDNYFVMEGVIYKVSIRVGAEREGAREPHNFFFFSRIMLIIPIFLFFLMHLIS